jgi:hypothetical protein
MVYLTMILDFFKNPKNRNIIIFAAIALFAFLFFRQCSKNEDLKNQLEQQKNETTRLVNNEEAKNAILLNYKLNDSTNRGIIQGYQLTQEELKKQFSSLTEGFDDLKKKTALALAKGTVIIKETKYIQTTVKIDSHGVEHLVGTDTMKVDADNWRYISFDAPFRTKYFSRVDSTEVDFDKYGIFSQTYPDKSKFTFEQSIGLKVGLFQDKKDKKVYIVAQSKYPGLTFSKLEGADIMADPLSRKATRAFRKEWGIGFNLSYGATVDLKTSKVAFGPQIGVGIHYTPKWLQFGK